jgi:hypothetical protein
MEVREGFPDMLDPHENGEIEQSSMMSGFKSPEWHGLTPSKPIDPTMQEVPFPFGQGLPTRLHEENVLQFDHGSNGNVSGRTVPDQVLPGFLGIRAHTLVDEDRGFSSASLRSFA